MTRTDLAGRPFPDIQLPGLDGIHRPVIRAPGSCVIGHSDCGTTRLLLPFMNRMHERRRPGTAVVVVLQDSPAEARELIAEQRLDVPVLLEADPYPLSRELGLTTVPTLLLLSPAGLVERAWEGFQRSALDDLAGRLGIDPPFFRPEDKAPALRPG